MIFSFRPPLVSPYSWKRSTKVLFLRTWYSL